MLTRPTPGSCEIFCASRVSARSSTCVSGMVFEVSAERQDRRVGRIDLGVDRRRRQVGGQQIAGGVDRRLHFLLGDIEAEMLRPNCRVMTEAPAELTEVIWLRLGIWPNCTSSGAVTEDVITSGLAPG